MVGLRKEPSPTSLLLLLLRLSFHLFKRRKELLTMPDQITVSEFVTETNEDYKSPTASNFTTRMSHCRNTVAALEEVSEIPATRVHFPKTLSKLNVL